MIEKKQSEDWNIAVTHWLTSGLAIPFVVGIIFFLGLTAIFNNSETTGNIIGFIFLFFSPIIYWLGVMYSARYINKKYFIKNSNKIAKLATIYILIIGGGYRLFQIINGSGLTLEHISFIPSVVAFYIASKKYIRTSDTIVQ